MSTHNRSVKPEEKGSAPLHGHPLSLSAASCLLCAWLHPLTQRLCSRRLSFASAFALSLAARARSRPASERPFDLSEAVSRSLSARPFDASEDFPIPRSTPVPAGGPPAERPAPRPRPCAEAITWSPAISRHTSPNLAIIFNAFCITFPFFNIFSSNLGGTRREESATILAEASPQ